MTRRMKLLALLPGIVGTERGGRPVHLDVIYAAIKRDHPTLVDDEIERPKGELRWKHDVRWELQRLVGRGQVQRRKDLGRSMYSI